jgi:Helicase HerA, central domain
MMPLVVVVPVVGAAILSIVLVVRIASYEFWRRHLVAFELRFVRGLDANAVAAALTGLTGLTSPRWLRSLVARAVVVEVHATDQGITHRILMPRSFAEVVFPQLRAALPGLRIVEIDDLPVDRPGLAGELGLNMMTRQLRVDAPEAVSAALLASTQPLEAGESVTLQWILQPVGPVAITRVSHKPGQRASSPDAATVRALREKQAAPLFQAAVRLGVGAEPARRRQLLRRTTAAFHTANAPGAHIYRRSTASWFVADAMARRSLPLVRFPCLLNVRELAGLIAFPIGDVQLPGLSLGGSREIPPSADLPRRGRVVAVSHYAGRERPLALSVDDSLRHLHVIGPTGVGKSTLLLSLITQDMRAGFGVVVIDPKGDLVSELLDRVPPGRTSDVVVLDPSDPVSAVGLNPLAHAGENGELVVEELTSLFRQLYRAFWGPRTDDILRAALLTLVREPGMTLCEVPLLLTDEGFRRRLVGGLDDPVGLEPFWGWFNGLSDGERTAAIGPVLNKLRAFVVRRRIRDVIGQSQPRLDLEEVLAKRRILLVPLRKGLLGDDAAALLGSLVVGQLWRAVQRRTAIAPTERCPVFAYVDEVQDYLHLPTSIGDVLAQARGLGLSLTLAHQHLAQLPTELRHAVLANARSRVAFQLASEDARALAPVFGAPVTPADLKGLDAYEVIVQLAVGNRVGSPASARTSPPPPPTGQADAAIRASREQYGVAHAEVEADIRARHDTPTVDGLLGRQRRTR